MTVSVDWLAVCKFLPAVMAMYTSFLVGLLWFSSQVWSSANIGLKVQHRSKHRQYPGAQHTFGTIVYAIQTLIITCIIIILLPSTICHSTSSKTLSLSFPLLCSQIFSILSASTAYPHHIYSGKSTLLYIVCVAAVLDAQYNTVTLVLVLLQTVVVSVLSWVFYFGYCQFELLWFCVFPSCRLREPSSCALHFQRIGAYAAQNAIISCVLNIFKPITESTSHPLTFKSLPLPLFSPLLISVLVSCMAYVYPHYLYSGKSTMLFLFCSFYDAIQATMATLAILFL